ncbi:MAG: helix-turn-helix transcriptional regulator [Candidatus Thiodiazotropha endolucinida]
MIDLGYIAERLRNARINQGISQAEAAEKCGVTDRTIRKYETKGIKDLVTLDMVCKCYGITMTVRIGITSL